MKLTPLEITALVLGIVHFSVPLAYCWYAKTKWLRKPWNLRVREDYKPRVTVIIPTYNEAGFIARRLDNIYEQDYPRDLVEVIVIDSASTDGTPEIVEKWAREHLDLKLKLLRESVRRGKSRALNEALKYAEGDIVVGDIVVIADADASWSRNALSETTGLFADPVVGAVSCVKTPEAPGPAGVEEGYREYYNVLRVAESKVYSTPVFHGELAAFRRELLVKLGGFPIDVGADDSYTAIATASMGYRAIVSDMVLCRETEPSSKWYYSWRVRRAQHLVQSFTKAISLVKRTNGVFKAILAVESSLHLLNPWLLLTALAVLLAAIVCGSVLAVVLLTVGTVLLVSRPYRSWTLMQLYLVVAVTKNIRSREIVWEKQVKRE